MSQTKHYVLEVTLKEVVNTPPSTTYRAGDRTPPPKGEREVNERLKFIATTDTLWQALERVTDWATSEKKYIPSRVAAEAKDVEVRSR